MTSASAKGIVLCGHMCNIHSTSHGDAGGEDCENFVGSGERILKTKFFLVG